MSDRHVWNVVVFGGGKQKRTLGPFSHREARSAALANERLGRSTKLVRRSDGHTIRPRFPELERRRKGA